MKHGGNSEKSSLFFMILMISVIGIVLLKANLIR
jgi:hypothetical protein